MAHLQAGRKEARSIICCLAADVVEGQFPALLAQTGAVQHHLAAQAHWRLLVERQEQAEVGTGWACDLQVAQRFSVDLLQRTLAQHGQQVRGIAGGVRVKPELGLAEMLDASAETLHLHPTDARAAIDRETIRLEAQVGVHRFRRRPLAMELQGCLGEARITG